MTDYYQVNNLRFYFLKIPYQLIKELHKIPFQKIMQPQKKSDINNIDDAIGFQFMKQPEVKSIIHIDEEKININITMFRSQSENGKKYENFETLSAVFVDKNYNDKDFILTNSFFSDELKRIDNKLEIIIPINDTGKKIMIIYIDIFGNEFSEVYPIKE